MFLKIWQFSSLFLAYSTDNPVQRGGMNPPSRSDIPLKDEGFDESPFPGLLQDH